ncbi:hypothetical protein AAMO2058_000366800 [Amorphochlora amoebiformis]
MAAIIKEGKASHPIAITQPVNDTLTTMCPSCQQLMQLPKTATIIRCPDCQCTSRIRVKYTTYFKCPNPACTADLRCNADWKRTRCPKCEWTFDIDPIRAKMAENKRTQPRQAPSNNNNNSTPPNPLPTDQNLNFLGAKPLQREHRNGLSVQNPTGLDIKRFYPY